VHSSLSSTTVHEFATPPPSAPMDRFQPTARISPDIRCTRVVSSVHEPSDPNPASSQSNRARKQGVAVAAWLLLSNEVPEMSCAIS